MLHVILHFLITFVLIKGDNNFIKYKVPRFSDKLNYQPALSVNRLRVHLHEIETKPNKPKGYNCDFASFSAPLTHPTERERQSRRLWKGLDCEVAEMRFSVLDLTYAVVSAAGFPFSGELWR